MRFVRGSFPDHTDLWMFQKQFTSQLALSAFANYVLMLSSGAPHTLLFALNSGNVIPWDMRVSCNASGHLVTPDPVPFRLTPNLVNVVSPVGITGLFCATMVASAQAITEPDYRIQVRPYVLPLLISVCLRTVLVLPAVLTLEPVLLVALLSFKALRGVVVPHLHACMHVLVCLPRWNRTPYAPRASCSWTWRQHWVQCIVCLECFIAVG